MEPRFWEDRWATGKIGFHEGAPNALLVKHARALEGRKRVLVPLCGKSEDLAFLASQGHEVVGIELVRDAIEAFFAERGIEAAPVRVGPYEGLAGDGITLLSGDFFLASKESLGAFDAIYDRAAIVALPPDMRDAYASFCQGLLDPGARILMITIFYDQSVMEGPPFSVDDALVRALYARHTITQLDASSTPPGPRFVALGIAEAGERIYTIDIL